MFRINREISLFCGPSTWKLCVAYLDYADNVIIFTYLFDTLKYDLLVVREQSQKLGLRVN